VLVQRIKAEAKTASGIFLPESSVKELNEAKVLAVGPGGFDKDGKRIACGVAVGDKVLIPQVSWAFYFCGGWIGCGFVGENIYLETLSFVGGLLEDARYVQCLILDVLLTRCYSMVDHQSRLETKSILCSEIMSTICSAYAYFSLLTLRPVFLPRSTNRPRT
jgi:hypothetical protein